MRRLWSPGVLAVALPAISCFALYGVMFGAIGVDDCNPLGITRVLLNAPLLLSAPFLILPPVPAWLRARSTGRVVSEQIFFVLVATVLTCLGVDAVWHAWQGASPCFN